MTSSEPRSRRSFVLAAMGVLILTACGTATPTTGSSVSRAAGGASGPDSSVQQTQLSPPAVPSPPALSSPLGVPSSPAAVPLRGTTPTQPAAAPPPATLQVAGTSIDMPVIPVGVAPGGAMEIPETFYQAGWYRFGPAPGAAEGTAVLAGHIDTTSDQAPFSQLKSLPAGTLITVGRQDAPALNYRVVSVTLMAKDAFDGESLFRRTGPHELKVVTCGGRWLDERMDYSDNVIVTAVLD
ncbi:class F sortase [Arthrobacter sp. FW305-123]|nr:class F sortase [Arthrobacter sp. FW305-123]